MSFETPLFLFCFLPVTLGIYWALPVARRNLFLLAASGIFYLWGEGRLILLLAAAILLNYALALAIARSSSENRGRVVLWAGIGANLLILFCFKYLNNIVAGLAPLLQLFAIQPPVVKPLPLPLGVSFFTFQAIAYLVDVARKGIVVERNLLKFSLFFALFAKIGVGPIIRYNDVRATLEQPVVSWEDCAAGTQRFIYGLAKKLILANALGKVVDPLFALPPGELTTPLAWLAIVCYTLQIYCDFSGYIDMALGLGRMFGYTLPENFNYPYTSRSLTEFWRRWHITLSSWFRDYLFTPLTYLLMTDKVRQKIAAGTYKTNYRTLWSVFIVFTVCGIWHGATLNFLIWGVLHGLILALEAWRLNKFLKKLQPVFSHAYFLLVIMCSWVFFRSPTPEHAGRFLATMVGFATGDSALHPLGLYLDTEVYLVLLLAVVCSVPIPRTLTAVVSATLPPTLRPAPATPYLHTVWTLLLFVLTLFYVAASTYSPAIYTKF